MRIDGMNVVDLIEKALALDISVNYMPLRRVASISYPGDIFIDTRYIDTQKEKELMAHELGHCVTGCFHYFDVDEITWAKCEYKADCHAIRLLVPEVTLKKVLSGGYVEIWELAEYFGVDEEFISKALKLYRMAQ
ncbi:MAG: ImmA/IrrE family metallo-endopeptidase [Chloroflexi bacterium]|nr:ImmA/IrrE family metallo-endopeptidase [Chloroflexota bacterium]